MSRCRIRMLLFCFLVPHAACEPADRRAGPADPRADGGAHAAVSCVTDVSAPTVYGSTEHGTAEVDEGLWFGQVSDGVLVDEHLLAVADGVRNQIVLIDLRTGETSLSGGTGSGPGEYMGLRNLVRVSAGEFIAFDSRARRLTFLSPAPLRVTRTAVLPQELPFSAVPLGVTADSNILFTSSTGTSATGNVRDSVRIGEYTLGGRLVRDFGTVPGSARVIDLSAGFSVWSAPFAGRTTVRLLGSMVAIVRGDSDHIELRGPVGGPERRDTRIAIPYPREPVTAAMRRSFEASQSNGDATSATARLLALVEYPDSTPRAETIYVDRTGHLWVQKYNVEDDAPVELIVLDAEGRPADSVRLPSGSRLLDASLDYLVTRRRSTLDVDRIEVHSRRCTADAEQQTTAEFQLLHTLSLSSAAGPCGAAFLGDRLLVCDRGQLRFREADGSDLAAPRLPEGIDSIRQLWPVHADSALVMSHARDDALVVAADGRIARTVRTARQPSPPLTLDMLRSDGSRFVASFENVGGNAALMQRAMQQGPFDDSVLVRLLLPDGEDRILMKLPLIGHFNVVMGNHSAVFEHPLLPQTHVGAGSTWFAWAVGATNVVSAANISQPADVRRFELDLPPAAVPDTTERWERFMKTTEGTAAHRERLRASGAHGPTPVLHALVGTQDGSLWVGEWAYAADGARRWHVLDDMAARIQAVPAGQSTEAQGRVVRLPLDWMVIAARLPLVAVLDRATGAIHVGTIR
jgi:hypothetical protein